MNALLKVLHKYYVQGIITLEQAERMAKLAREKGREA